MAVYRRPQLMANAAVLELSPFGRQFLGWRSGRNRGASHESQSRGLFDRTIGHIGRIDFARPRCHFMVNEAVRHGADEIEAKLLLRHAKPRSILG